MDKKSEMRTVPVVAIRGSVIFPHTDSILTFGRPKSIAAVNSAFQEGRIIAVFSQKDARVVNPKPEDLYKVGVIATISQVISVENGLHAVIKGQARIKLEKMLVQRPYLLGRVSEIPEKEYSGDKVEALSRQLSELFKKAINLGKGVEISTVMKIISGQISPIELVDTIALLLDVRATEKQKLLETFSVKKRLEKVVEFLSHEINILGLEKVISAKTQKRFESQMRKTMLREKKRTIEKELGEEDGAMGNEDIKELRIKIKKAKMPKAIRTKAMKELKRLSQLSPHNPEGGYIRNYLDWLVEMPWSRASSDKTSIARAAKILGEDHYGLEKAKQRILESLAVMKIKKKVKKTKKKNKPNESHSTILCFIGPPGVGKTSIGKSIARSLGRKFVRVSLGGIRDEAEIRGHRRTYVGALPGRIIQGVKNAGTKNPVFMLDEIDKLGIDFRGDPSSALLEALDPEQNREFSDHFLEIPFDLSEVMFICTGNILDTVPPPLRDRMEIIKFPGYTEEEKFKIARKYLWPKQLRLHGIENKKIKINKETLLRVIRHYTKEAGVRNLERNLATICRKVVRLIAERKRYPENINPSKVREFLGPSKFSSLISEKQDEVGMATGLAVTPSGGEILFIEIALMPGKGKLTLTGQLGEVMKESGKAAFTWAKSHHGLLGLKEDFAQGIDVHMHVPEGAVPKDGPSAGIAMTTALVSSLSGVSVKRDVGMTGEVTLRGRVLEVGGIKEKVLAGHRAGLKTIVLPKDNKKDLEDIPGKVKRDIKFVCAENLEQVLKVAMKKWPPLKKGRQLEPFRSRPSFLTAN